MAHRPADLQDWSAFPSDTATYYFALAFGLTYLLPRLAMFMLLYTAGWICLPRIYFGYHYAPDIVVGAAIGITVVWVSLRAERIHLLARLLAFEETVPQWFYAIGFLVSLEMANTFIELRAMARSALHAVHNRALFSHANPISVSVGVALASAALLVSARYRRHRQLPKRN